MRYQTIQTLRRIARVVNISALCVLGVCLPIVPTAFVGAITGLLTLDQAGNLFAFYVKNAAFFGPAIMLAFVAWACTDRAAELA